MQLVLIDCWNWLWHDETASDFLLKLAETSLNRFWQLVETGCDKLKLILTACWDWLLLVQTGSYWLLKLAVTSSNWFLLVIETGYDQL